MTTTEGRDANTLGWSGPQLRPQSDRELLRELGGLQSAKAMNGLLQRYGTLVFASACRQLGSASDAVKVSRAVFLALHRSARQLPRKTVLVSWLMEATRLASKKVKRARRSGDSAGGASRSEALAISRLGAGGELAGDTEKAAGVWNQISPHFDDALRRLSLRQRQAVLLRCVLNWNVEECVNVLSRRWKGSGPIAQAVSIPPPADAGQGPPQGPVTHASVARYRIFSRRRRLEARVRKGLTKLVRRLQKGKLPVDRDELQSSIIAEVCRPVAPENLAAEIFAANPELRRGPAEPALARKVSRAMKWVRWKRLLKAPSIALVSVLALAGTIALTSTILWKNGRLLPWLVEFGARQQVKKTPELGVPATAWEGANRNQALPQTAAELFRATNIWPVTLQFSAAQWLALAPRRVPPVANIMQPDGTIVLRNPKAQRSGVAGAIGFDYEWTPARVTVGGKLFSNVAVRLRGNGTYLGSLYGLKHSYKVDLDKFDSGAALAGIRTLNMLNMIEDRAYMSDVLGQELFRDAGVPAPRTAYVWLTIRVEGQWEGKPIGLYALVENVDADFAADRFGSKKTPIFKPVTPDLFKDLGPTWESYADTYDLKTKANQRQKQRIIDFSRLVTHADDAEFARRLSEFLDLDEFGRFLAALVLVANYDSLLTYGQNYYMYLDPRTDKLGFIPWDLDQGWGSFPHFGTSSARERVSVMHPWAGRNRFLERVLAVPEFQKVYRSHLGRLLRIMFVPERLNARIDELVATIRPAIAAESAFRLRLFDQATSTNWLKIARDGGDGPTRPVHQLKRFISNRAKSARDQLEGRARGLILERTVDWE